MIHGYWSSAPGGHVKSQVRAGNRGKEVGQTVWTVVCACACCAHMPMLVLRWMRVQECRKKLERVMTELSIKTIHHLQQWICWGHILLLKTLPVMTLYFSLEDRGKYNPDSCREDTIAYSSSGKRWGGWCGIIWDEGFLVKLAACFKGWQCWLVDRHSWGQCFWFCVIKYVNNYRMDQNWTR